MYGRNHSKLKVDKETATATSLRLWTYAPRAHLQISSAFRYPFGQHRLSIDNALEHYR